MLWHCRLLVLTTVLLSLSMSMVAATEQEPLQQPEYVSDELWQQLCAIDERLAEVETLRARFLRHRQTPLLRRPLISRGVVHVKGDMVHWQTRSPSPSITLIRDNNVQIYQPEERRVEVYPLDQRSEHFGSGPLPQITKMLESFTVEAVLPAELFDDTDEHPKHAQAALLALRLTPRNEQLAEQMHDIRMLIESESSQLLRFRLGTTPTQWTEYRFDDIEVDVELADEFFTLDLPPDVEVVRPLEGEQP